MERASIDFITISELIRFFVFFNKLYVISLFHLIYLSLSEHRLVLLEHSLDIGIHKGNTFFFQNRIL